MSDMVLLHDLGSLVIPFFSVEPQSSTGGVLTGFTVDRAVHGMANSCVLFQMSGPVSGAPTSYSIQTTLQHSADGVNWSAFEAGAPVQRTDTVVHAYPYVLSVDLTSALRFINVETTVTLTGGTSPSVFVTAGIILGGPRRLPIT